MRTLDSFRLPMAFEVLNILDLTAIGKQSSREMFF
jgi:hypothetical protein